MKIIKLLVGLALLGGTQYLFLGEFYLKGDIISDIITFLSIVFGFYITSLAIFVTSSYVSNLYKITDKENKSLSLLHTLIYNYKFGLIFILISIMYFLIIQFLLNQLDTDTSKIALNEYYLLPFLFFIIFNFWHGYKMLNDLIKIIIQESKRAKK